MTAGKGLSIAGIGDDRLFEAGADWLERARSYDRQYLVEANDPVIRD